MQKIFEEYKLILAEFTIIVQHKNVRRLILRVKNDSSIYISAPLGLSKITVQNFAQKNLAWLREKISARNPADSKIFYNMQIPLYGEKIFLWGSEFGVSFIIGAHRNLVQVFSDGVKFYLKLAHDLSEAERLACIKKFYAEQAKQAALPLLAEYERKMNVCCTKLRTRHMTSRWGSCNVRSGAVTLNLLLACWPRECLEYIVVHELAHLIVPNHSAEFHTVVENFLPDWRTHKNKLKNFKPVMH